MNIGGGAFGLKVCCSDSGSSWVFLFVKVWKGGYGPRAEHDSLAYRLSAVGAKP